MNKATAIVAGVPIRIFTVGCPPARPGQVWMLIHSKGYCNAVYESVG